jgi:diguanylate cyclase (GGDEF)-like protein/PAS domain S-box-containing protein
MSASRLSRGLTKLAQGCSALPRAVEAHLAFPAFALVFLAVLWAATLHFITTERTRAAQVSAVLSQEMADTYEAQVVRALHDIDQTLKFIQYVYAQKGQAAVLEELKIRALLLPDRLFTISINDRQGSVVASTRQGGSADPTAPAFFSGPAHNDRIWVSPPQPDPITGEPLLKFSRSMPAADGVFADVITVSVAAAYFVSNYEASKMGEQGAIGLLGTDGVFRSLRVGEVISSGETVDYQDAVGAVDESGNPSPQARVAWDGVRRFTSARKLYDFPLAVVVGLSEDEQSAAYSQRARSYLAWASVGSMVLILLAAALWRMSWQIEKGRRNEIAERQRSEQQLRIAATAFEAQDAMLIVNDQHLVLQVNRAFTADTGHREEDLVGHDTRALQSFNHDSDFYRAMWRCVKRNGTWQGEIWQRHRDGVAHLKWLSISTVKDATGRVSHYVSSQTDITERKRSEQRIHELAYFDSLTRLPNRTLLLERLNTLQLANAADGHYAALLSINLDNFKTLNDTLGRDVGDQLLCKVALRLQACMEEGHTVARLGGDEFGVLLTGLGRVETQARARSEQVSQNILKILGRSYTLKLLRHASTASIGVALFLDQRAAADALMKQANLAMYQAKEDGRNKVRFFDPYMEAAVMDRATLEADMRQGLAEQQFLLHYQPQVQGDSQIMGAEVLVRWLHPQRGMVSPVDFIPLAEETGLILPLGHWVLETACAQLTQWAGQPGMDHLTVAVNVSARQFHQADFLEQVLAVLARTGARPERLKLELTESMLVADMAQVIEKMHALKAHGIGFSLDDFGTGFSSLSYLKLLPLDQLKIDQAFVRDVLNNPSDAAIVKVIIGLAQALDLAVIAEGVETQQQRDFLAAAGCPAYQGYFFSRPLALAGFEAFARQRAHALAA